MSKFLTHFRKEIKEKYNFPKVESIPEPLDKSILKIDIPSSQMSKSVKSNRSNTSTLIKNLNMPVKFNDVDWTHINEMKTHERFEIQK